MALTDLEFLQGSITLAFVIISVILSRRAKFYRHFGHGLANFRTALSDPRDRVLSNIACDLDEGVHRAALQGKTEDDHGHFLDRIGGI